MPLMINPGLKSIENQAKTSYALWLSTVGIQTASSSPGPDFSAGWPVFDWRRRLAACKCGFLFAVTSRCPGMVAPLESPGQPR
jgi:hypothetical protein